jgi:hypothetical protein
MLVGAARAAETAREKAADLAVQQDAMRVRRTLERKHSAVERQIATLRSEYEAEEQEARHVDGQSATRTLVMATERAALGRLRQTDRPGVHGARPHTNGTKVRR